jgi:hypothetical protein
MLFKTFGRCLTVAGKVGMNIYAFALALKNAHLTEKYLHLMLLHRYNT